MNPIEVSIDATTMVKVVSGSFQFDFVDLKEKLGNPEMDVKTVSESICRRRPTTRDGPYAVVVKDALKAFKPSFIKGKLRETKKKTVNLTLNTCLIHFMLSARTIPE